MYLYRDLQCSADTTAFGAAHTTGSASKVSSAVGASTCVYEGSLLEVWLQLSPPARLDLQNCACLSLTQTLHCLAGTAPASSPPVSPPPATPAPATTPAAPATTGAAPVVTTAAPVPTTTAVPAKTPPTPPVTAAATPSPPATAAATPAPVGAAQVQPAYAQCGGASNCGSFGPCSDQAWTNAACTAGQTCTRSNA